MLTLQTNLQCKNQNQRKRYTKVLAVGETWVKRASNGFKMVPGLIKEVYDQYVHFLVCLHAIDAINYTSESDPQLQRKPRKNSEASTRSQLQRLLSFLLFIRSSYDLYHLNKNVIEAYLTFAHCLISPISKSRATHSLTDKRLYQVTRPSQ